MKKQCIQLLCLFSIGVNYSQTFIPDDNFEQALIDLGLDTPPLDNFVPTANIEGLISLNIKSGNINCSHQQSFYYRYKSKCKPSGFKCK